MSVTIEFLVSFTATLSLVFILASALALEHAGVKESMEKRAEIARVRSAARTIETWLNNGKMTNLELGGNLSFRIENRLIVASRDKYIEVEGVFGNERSEPV